MGLLAGTLAMGMTVASYPSVRPAEAIPRALRCSIKASLFPVRIVSWW